MAQLIKGDQPRRVRFGLRRPAVPVLGFRGSHPAATSPGVSASPRPHAGARVSGNGPKREATKTVAQRCDQVTETFTSWTPLVSFRDSCLISRLQIHTRRRNWQHIEGQAGALPVRPPGPLHAAKRCPGRSGSRFGLGTKQLTVPVETASRLGPAFPRVYSKHGPTLCGELRS